jgi:citrate lyase subunit beta/citryl-CoA lyase
VQPVDGVFADFRDEPGLTPKPSAARDGFTGKLAIHPAQVGPINAAFTPTRRPGRPCPAIVAAFAADPTPAC